MTWHCQSLRRHRRRRSHWPRLFFYLVTPPAWINIITTEEDATEDIARAYKNPLILNSKHTGRRRGTSSYQGYLGDDLDEESKTSRTVCVDSM